MRHLLILSALAFALVACGTPTAATTTAPAPTVTAPTAPATSTLAPRSVTTDPRALAGLTVTAGEGTHGHLRVTVTVAEGQPAPTLRWRVGGKYTHHTGAVGFEPVQNPAVYGLPADTVLEREVVPGVWVDLARG